MSAQLHHIPTYGFSDDTAAEVARLHALGYSVLPLGNGDDGKSPAVKFQNRARLPLDLVLGRLRDQNSAMYGIRLPGLLVVDIDTDTPAAASLVQQRFGASSVQVETARGRHHWFRIGHTPRPTTISSADLRIDFKSGPNSYVAGPRSIRRDGTMYVPSLGSLLDRASLPVFNDNEPERIPQVAQPRRIPVGQRNRTLYQRACEYAPFVDSEADLLGDLLAIRNIQCDEPETVPNAEVAKIANWAWTKRAANRIWKGRNSTVRIHRNVLDVLQNVPHGSEAFLLHSVLLSAHGHHPGKVFAIVPEAMMRSGLLTSLSRDRIYRAKDILLEHGLLVLHRRRVRVASLYRLGRMGQGEAAEGFISYIHTDFPGTGFQGQETGLGGGEE